MYFTPLRLVDKDSELGNDPLTSATLSEGAELSRDTAICNIEGETPKESAKPDPGAGMVVVVSIVVVLPLERDDSEETSAVVRAVFREESAVRPLVVVEMCCAG